MQAFIFLNDPIFDVLNEFHKYSVTNHMTRLSYLNLFYILKLVK